MRFLSFVTVSNGIKKNAIINMNQIEYIVPTENEDQYIFKMISGDHLVVEIQWSKLIKLYNLRADIKRYI